MPRERMVGWFERVARADPPAIQHHRSRDTRTMETPVPGGGSIYLRVGIWIRVFYLEPQDTKDLADLHLRDASRDWHDNGNVSVRAHHGRPQRGGVRPWSHGRRARTNQSAASGNCFVNYSITPMHSRLPNITFMLPRRQFALDQAIGIVRLPKG